MAEQTESAQGRQENDTNQTAHQNRLSEEPTRSGSSTQRFTAKVERELDALAKQRRTVMRFTRRRVQLGASALVGILAGVTAIIFQKGLEWSEWMRETIISIHSAHGWVGHLLAIIYCMGLIGLAAWLTHRFSPEAAGSGIPHVKGVLEGVRVLRWARVLVVKLVGGICAIGGGLSLGREGPTVHMGASVAAGVGEALRLPLRARRTLIAAGAGAGLAAAFNAPLAGFLFVLEELQKNMTATTYAAALVASACADVVTRLVVGERPSFRIVGYPAPPLRSLPLVIGLGLLAGLVGILFNRSLLASVRAGRRLPKSRGILIALLAALAALYVPAVAGGGHRTAEIVLKGDYLYQGGIVLMIALMAAKFGLTMVSYASGVPGGIFAPMLVIGAFLGLAFGAACSHLPAEWNAAPQAYAVIGMAALFVSVTRAPRHRCRSHCRNDSQLPAALCSYGCVRCRLSGRGGLPRAPYLRRPARP
jgi:CIC family chloride channel protein